MTRKYSLFIDRQGGRPDHDPSHDEDEIRSGTTSLPDNATVCLSSTQTAALNASIDNEEVLLSDEVFESSPTQHLLSLTDSVRRLAGGFQNASNLQADDGEWVSTSSGSESPVIVKVGG